MLRALDEGSLGARPGTARGRAGDLPLSGYRVLDFCWMAAGPLITELLANLGADVVKVESATGIDQVREFVHPPTGFGIDTGGFFADCNTNKRSLTLNLHKPETVAFIKRHLLPRFDMVTSNYAPDAMSKWGLGPEHLLPLRPDLVIGSFPVMGHSGPKSHWRAIGNGVLALSGVPGHMGEPDRPPVGMGTLHTDFTLAPIAAAGLIAALLQREETGEGQFLEIAQYEASVHLLDTELIDQLVNGVTAARRGNASADAVPHGIYPTAGDDRWVAISAGSDAQWRALCDVMGRDGPGLTIGPRRRRGAARRGGGDQRRDRGLDVGRRRMGDRGAAAGALHPGERGWRASRTKWSGTRACATTTSPTTAARCRSWPTSSRSPGTGPTCRHARRRRSASTTWRSCKGNSAWTTRRWRSS